MIAFFNILFVRMFLMLLKYLDGYSCFRIRMLAFTNFCNSDYIAALVHELDHARQEERDATKGRRQ